MNKYFDMRNLANNEAEICLFGVIREKSWWDEEDPTTSAKGFKNSLDSLGEVSTIYVNINSLGGSVFEGQAIYSMLKRHEAKIHVRVEGVAASIASVIAMAGDVIEIPCNAQFMIHNPATGVWGEVKDLERGIRMLNTATDAIISTYYEKTGIPTDELKELMNSETWYSGKEAVEAGFGTEVTPAVNMSACAKAGTEMLNFYKHPPRDFKQVDNNNKDLEIDYDLLASKVAKQINISTNIKNKSKKNHLHTALRAMHQTSN